MSVDLAPDVWNEFNGNYLRVLIRRLTKFWRSPRGTVVSRRGGAGNSSGNRRHGTRPPQAAPRFRSRVSASQRIAGDRMKYEVLISQAAQQEAKPITIGGPRTGRPSKRPHDSTNFIKAAFSLEENPDRSTFAPENGRFPYEVRQLNFGIGHKPTHRIVYTVRSKEIVILHVRHSAQARYRVVLFA